MASPDERKRHTVTIRWSLIRNLALLLVLLTGAMLFGAGYFGSDVRDQMSGTVIDRALDNTEAQLRRYFDPVEKGLLFSRRLMGNGTLDPDDPFALNHHFIPLIGSIPQISSVNLADADGAGYLLMRDEGRWRNRLVRADEWGGRQEFIEWSDESTRLREWTVEEPTTENVYDPRSRAWYQVAQEAAAELEPGTALPERVYWTEPYAFFTTGEPGITAMVHARGPGGRRWVIALDVLLRDLSDYTRALEVSPHGMAAVLAEDGALLGLPGLPRFEDPTERDRALLKRPIETDVPQLHAAAVAYQRLLPDPPDHFPFTSGTTRYWADVRRFGLGANRRAQAVVIVPEGDLVGPVNRLRVMIVGVAFLGFAGALALAVLLARRYSRPLSMLAENSERIGALELGELAPVDTTLREVDQLATEQERMRVALDSFSRYVPVDVVRELMARGEAARIGGARRLVTVLFTDIRGFTTVAEAMEPEILTAHLAEYFEALMGIVQGDGFGTVTQLTGDGLVGFWGAPRSDPEHAAHAAAAVLACCARLEELNEKWRSAGKPELFTRYGLATGTAVVGNVGAASRLVYTAIGDTVNLSSRLEGLSRFYGTSVLGSGETVDAAGEGFEWRLVDVVRVKGKSRPVGVHELLGAAGTVPEERLQAARRYEEALGCYRQRRFAEARAMLESLAAERSEDASVARLLGLAKAFEQEPPGQVWDGVTDFFEK